MSLALRGYLTSYTNLCFATGQLISAGVLEGLIKVQNEWSYRVPFGVQWAWPVPLFAGLLFAPVRMKGRRINERNPPDGWFAGAGWKIQKGP